MGKIGTELAESTVDTLVIQGYIEVRADGKAHRLTMDGALAVRALGLLSTQELLLKLLFDVGRDD